MISRRSFIKTSTFASIALTSGSLFADENKTHIITLSFDDGFKKSFYKVANIYEKYGLSACFNVIASGHLPDFKGVDQWILPELMGDFDDWNELKNRGHEVMPHSWKHLNLAQQPLEEAKQLIVKCLNYFQDHLVGYKNSESVFNFPFNASTPELEEFVLSQVMALRSFGGAVNDIPAHEAPFRLGCSSKGPGNIDQWVNDSINEFLLTNGGWLILNLHGLDYEGWGPMSETFLNNLIKKLSEMTNVQVLPTGQVLQNAIKKL